METIIFEILPDENKFAVGINDDEFVTTIERCGFVTKFHTSNQEKLEKYCEEDEELDELIWAVRSFVSSKSRQKEDDED